jgi:hypothetical protein
MDILQETKDSYSNKKTFFNHVFSTTEEGQGELLNVGQYAIMGVIPVILLNKFIQRFIPEADGEKSSLEITFEIFMQLIIMFCGIVIIHRIITYAPTYSGFKYDNLSLTNVILAFLIIVLSIQTKMGIKVNILVDRVYELWNGPSSNQDKKSNIKKSVRINESMISHNPSQADYLDGGLQTDMFPPPPVVTSNQGNSGTYDHMMRGGNAQTSSPMDYGPMPANALLGGSLF